MHPDDRPAVPMRRRPTAMFCLRGDDDPADWYLDQVRTFGAIDWAPATDTDDATWVEQAAQAIAAHTGGEPAHVHAAGRAVPNVLALAVRRPDLVASVLASDPAIDADDPAFRELLHRVRAPTLVLVAAPRPDCDLSAAQAIAGGVDNGVMVIIDGTAAPVHRQAPHSFNEWVTSFMSIAEGLATFTRQETEESHA